ncbi:histidine-rich protein PFHRP-II-like [Fundulus heteroclitus]|uniref:histidine-rich protein PFHRP-II-like n=1 Tax=Fundulus heteroclitus TaxID=8078 RepID=UPI00165A6857|nr:histidine-rich protein PFHRP-II-like [Fundulus heteroclitus]
MKVLVVLVFIFLSGCNGGHYEPPSQRQVEMAQDAYWQYVQQSTSTPEDYVRDIRHSPPGQYLCSLISKSIDLIYNFYHNVYTHIVRWTNNFYNSVRYEIDHLKQDLEHFLLYLEADVHHHAKELAAQTRSKLEGLKESAVHYIEALDPKGFKIALQEKIQDLHEHVDKCFEHLDNTHHHHHPHDHYDHHHSHPHHRDHHHLLYKLFGYSHYDHPHDHKNHHDDKNHHDHHHDLKDHHHHDHKDHHDDKNHHDYHQLLYKLFGYSHYDHHHDHKNHHDDKNHHDHHHDHKDHHHHDHKDHHDDKNHHDHHHDHKDHQTTMMTKTTMTITNFCTNFLVTLIMIIPMTTKTTMMTKTTMTIIMTSKTTIIMTTKTTMMTKTTMTITNFCTNFLVTLIMIIPMTTKTTMMTKTTMTIIMTSKTTIIMTTKTTMMTKTTMTITNFCTNFLVTLIMIITMTAKTTITMTTKTTITTIIKTSKTTIIMTTKTTIIMTII